MAGVTNLGVNVEREDLSDIAGGWKYWQKPLLEN